MLRRLLAGAAAVVACGGFAAAAHGASPLYVSLTFDDGLQSQINNALPALQGQGLKATFYINSGKIGTAGYMSWNNVTSLQSSQMEIGGHTVDHANLVDTWNNAADTTTAGRTAAVTAKVCPDRADLVSHGFNPTSFAYPNGAWKIGGDTSTIPSIIQSCGYTNARTTEGIALEPPDRHCDICYAPLSDRAPTNARPWQPFGLRASQARGDVIAQTGEPGNDNLIPFTVLRDRTQAAITSINDPNEPPAAEGGGGWLILVLHDVCAADGVAPCTASQPAADRGHSTTTAALTQYLAWLKARTADSCVFVKTVQQVMAQAQPDTCPPPANPGGGNPGGGNPGGGTPGGGGGGGAVGGGGGGAVTTPTPAPAPVEAPPAPPVTEAPSTAAPEPAAPTVRLLKASSRLLGKGIVGFRALVTAPAGVDHVEFLVNGKVVGTATQGPFKFSWSPKHGKAKKKVRTVKISVRVVDSLGRVVESGDPVKVKVRLATAKKKRSHR
jgi:peptidoglycan/xylan/chitin deacetylase (PgdA/CDA1 family)